MNTDSGEIIAVKEIEILKLSDPGEQERQKKRFEFLRTECHKLEVFCHKNLVRDIASEQNTHLYSYLKGITLIVLCIQPLN